MKKVFLSIIIAVLILTHSLQGTTFNTADSSPDEDPGLMDIGTQDSMSLLRGFKIYFYVKN